MYFLERSEPHKEVRRVASGPSDPPRRQPDEPPEAPRHSDPRQRRSREPRIEHTPPGPTDDRTRGLPLASPWGLPPFASPTPEEEPEAQRGRRPYGSRTADADTGPRRRRLVSRPDKLVATGQARPYPVREKRAETEERPPTADTRPYPRQGVPLRQETPRPAERPEPDGHATQAPGSVQTPGPEQIHGPAQAPGSVQAQAPSPVQTHGPVQTPDQDAPPGPADESGEWSDTPQVRRVGRPPAGRPTRPDLLDERPHGPGGRHHRGLAPSASRRSSPIRRRRSAGPVAALVAVVLIVGVGVFAWRQFAGDTAGLSLAAGELRSGDAWFKLSSAVSGSNQKLNDLATVGQTVVAVGSDTTSPAPRPLFLFSPDAGRTWRLGKVDDSPTATVLKVVGGTDGWLAVGDDGTGVGLWTSADGSSWESVRPAGLRAFQPGESIRDLTRASGGYVAVGGTEAAPAAWTSPDGRAWTRSALDRPGTRTLEAVEALGETVVAVGGPSRGAGSQVIRSTDGGRSWRATGDRFQEARPVAGTLAVLPKQFVLVPTARRTQDGQVQVDCSATGERWKRCGSITGLDAQSVGVDALRSYPGGVAAISQVGLAGYAVLTSSDAKTWRARASIGQLGEATLRGFAITANGTVVAGGDQATSDIDNRPVLIAAPPGGSPSQVDVGGIPGLARAAREVSRVTVGAGRYVAVGSASGDAGLWTSSDGESWRAASLGGPGRQELRDVAYGRAGWLAVGDDAAGANVAAPLVVSADDEALTWRKAAAPTRSGSSASLRAVVAGRSGYVLGGETLASSGTAAAALWFTADGRAYTKAKQLPQGGADVRLYDLAAVGGRYFAVGGAGGPGQESGVLWWSEDGVTWKARPRVLPEGATSAGLRQVVAFGDRLVVVGTALRNGVREVFAGSSADGGRSWGEYAWLPAERPAEVYDLAATEEGVVAVGSYDGDGAVWISVDGRRWNRTDLAGGRLAGEGRQWLAAVALAGTRVVGLGRSATYDADHLVLWTTTLSAG